MAAGIKYNFNKNDKILEYCIAKTIYRLTGGFNLVDKDVDKGSFIPVLAPLEVDFEKRTAKVSKSVRVVAPITGTNLKIAKGSLVKQGMHLSNGTKGATIQAIDKSNSEYDTLSLSATIAGVKKGAILFEATTPTSNLPKNKANCLNYAGVKKEEGATVTAVGQVFEIKSDKLVCPVSQMDKKSLGARFMFV